MRKNLPQQPYTQLSIQSLVANKVINRVKKKKKAPHNAGPFIKTILAKYYFKVAGQGLPEAAVRVVVPPSLSLDSQSKTREVPLLLLKVNLYVLPY